MNEAISPRLLIILFWRKYVGEDGGTIATCAFESLSLIYRSLPCQK